MGREHGEQVRGPVESVSFPELPQLHAERLVAATVRGRAGVADAASSGSR
jgi:hypothetical protein